MNWIFAGLVVASIVTAAFTGKMQAVTEASLTSAKSAVELSISLIGQMTLWLGFMGVLREAGVIRSLARVVHPLMRRLFPEVPPDHPAMGAMIMNIAANMLGLGNAATPFGLKAMQELDALNTRKGVATNSMALFLAINTSGVAVLPLGVVAVRTALGSHDPAGIIVPSLLATAFSTVCAVTTAKLLERTRFYAADRYAMPEAPVGAEAERKPVDAAALEKAEQLVAIDRRAPLWRQLIVLAIALAVIFALVRQSLAFPPESTKLDITRSILSNWLLPLLMLTIVAVGFAREAKVYEAFVAAAKEGFTTSVTIIPFLVAILVAVGMFRASGGMEVLISTLTPVVAPFGFPAEALPMALIRPLSGSGALGVMSDTIKASGPDTFIGYLVSVLNGTTETTFYVLALYFGSVQVKVMRHALPACVVADFAGPVAALFICRVFFGAVA